MLDLPIVTTPYVVSEIMKEFILRTTGMDDKYAEILAQLHVQVSRVIPNWAEFLMNYCTSCEHSPSSCPFLHPPESSCPKGVTPGEISDMNRKAVTSGRIEKCPTFSRIRTPTTDIPVEGEPNDNKRKSDSADNRTKDGQLRTDAGASK